MNKIIVTGNLTSSPIINSTNSGKALTKFGIAVKRPYAKNNETDFFNVTVWGATAEFVCKYFDKGRRALIEGRLQTSKYKGKDGVERVGYDIIADTVEFADSKKKAAESEETDTSGGTDYDDVPVPF